MLDKTSKVCYTIYVDPFNNYVSTLQLAKLAEEILLLLNKYIKYRSKAVAFPNCEAGTLNIRLRDPQATGATEVIPLRGWKLTLYLECMNASSSLTNSFSP